MKNKVWFITGASRGLGLALTKKLLAAGYHVAATSRNAEDLIKAIGAGNASFLPLPLDVNSETAAAHAIETAVQHFGRIDVLVNNAGYGLLGALEELTDTEARENFNTNVFGALNVIRQALPYLRKQQAGHIFNVSSIGGFTGAFPGFGIYCATKFALQGLSESLAAEVQPFGIHVTVVSPGYFRTDFLKGSSLRVPQHEMPEYKNVRNAQDLHQHSYNGVQPGDPDKAAAVFIEVAGQPAPPLHLFLGLDAYQRAAEKITAVQKDMQMVEALATATAFEA